MFVMAIAAIHKALDEKCKTAAAVSSVDDIFGVVPNVVLVYNVCKMKDLTTTNFQLVWFDT